MVSNTSSYRLDPLKNRDDGGKSSSSLPHSLKKPRAKPSGSSGLKPQPQGFTLVDLAHY